jgi:hypothetical protein
VGISSDDAEFNITSAQLTGAGFAGNQLLPLHDIRMGNNGAVCWNNNASEVGYANRTDFPTMAAANGGDTGNGGLTPGTSFLCPLWDDNIPVGTQTGNCLYWQVIGGNLILEWTNQEHYGFTGAGAIQYEAIVYGGATISSGAPLVDFVYNDTFYATNQYSNDGGSATIGYKNWNTIATANDVEFGMGGGNNTVADPPFGDPSMRPKVGGYMSSSDPTLPHAVRIRGASTFLGFCLGDGSGTQCPCGNNSPVGAGSGCLSSVGTGGHLAGTGTASIASDTFVLVGSGMPNSSALYFQGTSQTASGLGLVFGDGLRCAGGSVIRLGTKTNVAGSSQYPTAGNPLISVKGANVAGNVRTYQVWYRNAAAYCNPETFNLSNGLQATWGP